MPKAKILIVEDEAIVAEDLSRKLNRLSYEELKEWAAAMFRATVRP